MNLQKKSLKNEKKIFYLIVIQYICSKLQTKKAT